MIEALVERAVQAELCRALGRSLQEARLPPGVAQEMCSRLLIPAQVDKEQTDAAAAAALGVEDDDDLVPSHAEQPLPSEVPMSATKEKDSRAETPSVDELIAWLVSALEHDTT